MAWSTSSTWAAPRFTGYEEWLNEHNHIGPLVELGGHRLAKREENGTTRFYLEEDHIELKRYPTSRSLGGCRIQNDMDQAKCLWTADHICHKRFG
jgi:hypothetical protein